MVYENKIEDNDITYLYEEVDLAMISLVVVNAYHLNSHRTPNL